MREIVKLEHRLITENNFRQLEFVKGSTDYGYTSKPTNQGLTWENTMTAIVKKVDDDLLLKLAGPSVFRITGTEDVLEIGSEYIPARAEITGDEQVHLSVKLIDIRLKRRLL